MYSAISSLAYLSSFAYGHARDPGRRDTDTKFINVLFICGDLLEEPGARSSVRWPAHQLHPKLEGYPPIAFLPLILFGLFLSPTFHGRSRLDRGSKLHGSSNSIVILPSNKLSVEEQQFIIPAFSPGNISTDKCDFDT